MDKEEYGIFCLPLVRWRSSLKMLMLSSM